MEVAEKIEKFFEKHGIEANHVTSRSYIFDCPSCGGQDKLYVQKKDGKSICFKGKDHSCPKTSDSLEFVLSVVSGLDLELVKIELEQGLVQVGDSVEISFDDVKLTDQKTGLEPIAPSDLPQDILPISSEPATEGRQYLEKRGITLDMMKKYGMMYSPGMRRVIFPVIMDDKIYGWQGRAIDPVDKNDRMRNLPGEWKSKSLMFKDNLRNSEHVIIAEGPISALKFEKVGGFVATMGKMISQDQLDIIRKTDISKVYLALDRDAADNTAKLRDHFMIKVEPYIPCYLIEVPEHRDDFGDCSFEECEEAFKSARMVARDELFLYIEG